jgi:hypothetical protein
LISEALAESIEAWSLASCAALSEAVESSLPVDEPPPVGFDPEVGFVDVSELGVVADPPEPPVFEPLPEVPADPVPAPGDELELEEELRSLASVVSALASAAWSVWTCC